MLYINSIKYYNMKCYIYINVEHYIHHYYVVCGHTCTTIVCASTYINDMKQYVERNVIHKLSEMMK